ncbi:MAG: TolC family protein [bacterium]|nr:MAG: TolC family protein [bacterium]
MVRGGLPPGEARAQDLTLDEAYRIALERNHDLMAAEEDVEQGRLLKRQAITVLFPNLTATAGYSRMEFDDGSETEGNSWGLSLNQTLYNGGRVWVAKRGADYTLAAAQMGLEYVKQSILMDLVVHSNQLLSAEDILLVSGKRVERVREQVRRAEARLEVGDVPRTAVLAASVTLSRAEMEQVEARKAVSIAQTRLAALIGSDSPVRVLIPRDPDVPKEAAFEDLLQRAIDGRADLAQARELIRISEQEAELVARSDNPNVDITGSYTRFSEENSFVPERQIGVTLTWPFFQGGLVGLQTKEARSRVRQVQQMYLSRVDNARLQVEEAWLTLNALRVQEKMVRSNLTNALENHRLAKAQFELGAAVILDVLDAEEDLAEAEYLEVSHKYETRTALAALLYSIGALDIAAFGTD